MSEVENIEEEVANPYNSKKPWQTMDRPNTDDADSLFYAPQEQATPEEAPEDEAQPKKRTNYKKRYDDLKNIMMKKCLNLNNEKKNYRRKQELCSLSTKLLNLWKI